MGLFAEFDVIADFGYLDQTEEYGIIPDYSEGCDVFVEMFLKYSRQLVPVRTGYLRSTLDAGSSDTSCYAETDCDYAEYVEYGTSYMGAQPYFEPAFEMALAEAEPLWNQAQENALLEEQMLIAEEQMMREQQMQQASSRGGGPQQFGGLNFSSPGAFIGSVLGMLLVAIVITTVQVIMGKDFSSGSGGRGRGGGGGGGVFMPEVIIT